MQTGSRNSFSEKSKHVNDQASETTDKKGRRGQAAEKSLMANIKQEDSPIKGKDRHQPSHQSDAHSAKSKTKNSGWSSDAKQ